MNGENDTKPENENGGLSEMIDAVGSIENADDVYRIRRKRENETGIPMEEDDLGKAESELYGRLFPGITSRLESKD